MVIRLLMVSSEFRAFFLELEKAGNRIPPASKVQLELSLSEDEHPEPDRPKDPRRPSRSSGLASASPSRLSERLGRTAAAGGVLSPAVLAAPVATDESTASLEAWFADMNHFFGCLNSFGKSIGLFPHELVQNRPLGKTVHSTFLRFKGEGRAPQLSKVPASHQARTIARKGLLLEIDKDPTLRDSILQFVQNRKAHLSALAAAPHPDPLASRSLQVLDLPEEQEQDSCIDQSQAILSPIRAKHSPLDEPGSNWSRSSAGAKETQTNYLDLDASTLTEHKKKELRQQIRAIVHSSGTNATFFKNLSTKLNRLDLKTCADESVYLKLRRLLAIFEKRLESKVGANLQLVTIGSFSSCTLRSYKPTVDCVFKASPLEAHGDPDFITNDRFKDLMVQVTDQWQDRPLTASEQELDKEFQLNLSPIQETKLVHRLCFQEDNYLRSIIGTHSDEDLKIKVFFMEPREKQTHAGASYKLNKIDSAIQHSHWFAHTLHPNEESMLSKPFAAIRLLKIWK